MIDVAIVGAGPAGTAAAYDLLAAGRSVLIMDRTEFPRPKACAGGLTPKTVHALRYDISPVVRETCRRVKVTRPGGDSFFIGGGRDLCYMVKREEMDDFSLKKVMAKGGQFRVVNKIEAVSLNGAGVEIQTDENRIRARYLIGADGANSIVRRLTTRLPKLCRGWAVQAEIPREPGERFDMEFAFQKDGSGYNWVFPRDTHLNIGVAVLNQKTFKKRYLYEWAAHRFGRTGLQSVRGGAVSSGGWHYTPVSDAVFLVGDAAGFTEPLLGEGLYNAVKSGQAAAAAIIRAPSLNASEKKLYGHLISDIKKDLKLYNIASKLFYRTPRFWLKMLSFSFLNAKFERGYAAGRTFYHMTGLSPGKSRRDGR